MLLSNYFQKKIDDDQQTAVKSFTLPKKTDFRVCTLRMQATFF